VSAFDIAADEAMAEFDAAESGEEGQVDTDTPEVAESSETTPEVVAEPATPAEGTPESPWWESHLQDEVEFKGQKMTLEEAFLGGLRQSDYTRKQQQLAEERQYAEWGKALAARLQQDPVAALQELARQAKLIPADQQEFDPSEPLDPAMVAVSELDRKVEELTLREKIAETRQEIADVKAEFPDFNDDVLRLVAEYGGQGIGLTIRDGYLLWRGQKTVTDAQSAERARLKAEQDAAALAAAKAAQVGSGHSPAANTSDEKDYSDIDPKDLFEAIANEVFGSYD